MVSREEHEEHAVNTDKMSPLFDSLPQRKVIIFGSETLKGNHLINGEHSRNPIGPQQHRCAPTCAAFLTLAGHCPGENITARYLIPDDCSLNVSITWSRRDLLGFQHII